MRKGAIGFYTVRYVDVFIKQGDVYNPMTDAFPFTLSFSRTTYKGVWNNTIPTTKYMVLFLKIAGGIFGLLVFWYFKTVLTNKYRRWIRKKWWQG
jgi:hypothetical protein